MQQTDQYELNQWDPTDRILREDFNADNLKIAAALAGKLDRAELIFHYVPATSTANSGGFNLRLIPWGDWEFVGVHASFPEGVVPEDRQVEVSLNQRKPVLGAFPYQDFFLLFWTRHNLEEPVRGLFLGPQLSLILPKYTYAELHSLSLQDVTEAFPHPSYSFYGFG